MASFGAKAFVLIQLSLLLLNSFTVLAYASDIGSWIPAPAPRTLPTHPPAEAPKPHKGHHHHHKHAPNPAPAKPPSPPHMMPPAHPPVKPPSSPPTKPPSYPISRKLFAVQGVVYCKSCKYPGIDTLQGATPLVGAVVKLQCNNTKYKPNVAMATTDKNGYFFLMPKNVTTAASHKCKVFLVSSPSKTCDVPTNLHAGSVGAILMPTPPPKKPVPSPPPYQIYTVGPFAFQPSKEVPCPR